MKSHTGHGTSVAFTQILNVHKQRVQQLTYFTLTGTATLPTLPLMLSRTTKVVTYSPGGTCRLLLNDTPSSLAIKIPFGFSFPSTWKSLSFKTALFICRTV